MTKVGFSRKFRNFKRRACGIALSAVLAVGMLPVMSTSIAQAKESSYTRSPEELYDSIMKTNNEMDVPGAYNKDVNPYGYGFDVPFFINQQSEILTWNSNNMDSGNTSLTINSYDNLKSDNTGAVYDGASINKSYGVPNKAKQLNYVQMVSLDPTNSGRKDHFAVIGVLKEDSDYNLYLFVGTKGKNDKGQEVDRWSSGLNLGAVNGIGDTSGQGDGDDSWLYNSMGFLSVTAGDYNGNGTDSIVVWGCYTGTGYGLNEIEVIDNGSTISLSKKNNNGHNKALLHNIYTNNSVDANLLKTNTWAQNLLCAKLDSGDINGDGVDDLVAVSYVSYLSRSYDGREQMTDLYRPYLAVSYGDDTKSDSFDFSSKRNKEMGVWSNNGEWNSCIAPGLSLGDVDGDNVKEIVVAGLYNSMSGGSGKKVIDPYRIKENKTYVALFEGDLSMKMDTTVDTNSWTTDGTYTGSTGDNIWQQTAVQCVNINGVGNPAMIFISGDLYAFEGDNIVSKHKPEYFQYGDDGLGGDGSGYPATTLSVTFINSVTAGNFDGNDKGFEQVVFTIGLKVDSKESYRFTTGMIGGKKHDEKTGLSAEYYSTSRNTIESNYFPGPSAENDGHLTDNDGLNAVVCAIDNDTDGILARYKGKDFFYTDPEPMVILQAAPYYNDMYDYLTDTNATSYTVFENFSYDQSSSTSTSFGIGFTQELTTPIVVGNLTAGYSNEWTKTFTDSYSKQTTLGWTAHEQDTIVVRRVPVISYIYEVQDKESGTWKKDSAMDIACATEPVYTQMSIDEYNGFVEYYNEKMKATNGYNKLSAEKKAAVLLTKLDDKYLGHEGNPLGYMMDGQLNSNIDKIQSQYQHTGAGSSSSQFEWSEENNSAVSEEISHGFSVDGQILIGAEGGGFGFRAGFTSSLDVMSGKGTSTTTGRGKGVSAAVHNISNVALENAAGDVYDIQSAATRYAFDWKMIRWNSNIKDSTGKYVPIFGYVLNNIQTPSPKVNEFEGKLELEETPNGSNYTIKLSWEDPSIEGNPVDKYRIYYRDYKDDGKTVIRRQVGTDLSKDTLSYNVDVSAFNGKKDFVFTITTVDAEGNESVESNKVKVVIDPQGKSIADVKKTASEGLTDTYTIYYSDGTKSTFEITNGKDGVDGINGVDGVGIKSVEFVSSNGNEATYVMTFTDNTTFEYTVNKGINGKSAYEIAVDNGFVGTEVEWLESLKGQNGKDGQNGLDGKDGKDGQNGQDGKDGQNGQNGKDGSVVTGSSIGVDGINGKDGQDGKDGANGLNGTNGTNGLSAYEIAVNHGFVGTEEQWLESLKVVIVEKGESAYEIAVRNGFTGTEADWLESLKGQNGTDGKDGKDGANGSNYYGSGSTTVINGKDGVGIADVTLSANGDLVVTLSDGSKKVAGNILTSVDLDSYLKAKIDAITGADESEHHDGDDKDTDGTDEEPDVANVFFSKVSRPSSVAKALSLKWTKAADVDGYEIRYCLKKDFEKSKTVVVKASNSKKSYQKLTIKELKGARTYYVQIRAFVEEDGIKYYSDWSDTVSKKTLKKVAANSTT